MSTKVAGRGGGLLLCSPTPPPVLIGLGSGTGFAGVLPKSTYFQNGAGELCGKNVDGTCAVDGGPRCTS